jgi:hypothetical protein
MHVATEEPLLHVPSAINVCCLCCRVRTYQHVQVRYCAISTAVRRYQTVYYESNETLKYLGTIKNTGPTTVDRSCQAPTYGTVGVRGWILSHK